MRYGLHIWQECYFYTVRYLLLSRHWMLKIVRINVLDCRLYRRWIGSGSGRSILPVHWSRWRLRLPLSHPAASCQSVSRLFPRIQSAHFLFLWGWLVLHLMYCSGHSLSCRKWWSPLSANRPVLPIQCQAARLSWASLVVEYLSVLFLWSVDCDVRLVKVGCKNRMRQLLQQ